MNFLKISFVVFVLLSVSAVSAQRYLGVEKSECTFKINNKIDGFDKQFKSIDDFESIIHSDKLTAFEKIYEGDVYCEKNIQRETRVVFRKSLNVFSMEIFTKAGLQMYRNDFLTSEIFQSQKNKNYILVGKGKKILKLLIFENHKSKSWRIGSIWFQDKQKVCAVQSFGG